MKTANNTQKVDTEREILNSLFRTVIVDKQVMKEKETQAQARRLEKSVAGKKIVGTR